MSATGRPMLSDKGRGGFTLIELLVTMTVIGILTGIAIPNFRASIARADASRIAADMTVVRTAVFEYREDNGELPRRGQWGQVPEDLEDHLDIEFDHGDVRYRLVTNRRRGRVEFRVRYPRRGELSVAMRRFMQPGTTSGSVNWSHRQTRWRLLEDNE